MPCIGIDDEASSDPLGAFEQRQRVGKNVVTIFSREQGEADGCGERGFEIERESRRDRSVEDIARRGLKAVAVENGSSVVLFSTGKIPQVRLGLRPSEG